MSITSLSIRTYVFDMSRSNVENRLEQRYTSSLEENPKRENVKGLVPVWFDLPARFYRNLQRVADECGLSMAQTLSRGIRLVLKEHRGKKQTPKLKSPGTNQLTERRWAQTPPAERSRQMSELSRKRWAKSSESGEPQA